jgi:predicted permease
MDLKFALRSMRNNPGFTLLAVIVMALGIGANTAVFSVVNTVLLKPLAYRDPDRIVTIRNFWQNTQTVSANISGPDFGDFHDQATSFDAMGYYIGGQTPVLIGGTSEYAQAFRVTPEFFKVFQVEPMAGRMFNDDEQKPHSSGAAIISAGFWQRRFGGNRNALGATVRVYGKDLTIVGVLSPGFDFPNRADIYYPENTIVEVSPSRSSHNYRVYARLKQGVTLEQARIEMDAIGKRLAQSYPPSNQGKDVTVDRMRDALVRNVQLTLYVLLGAVAVVLLIACANMASLLLAKSTARTREIAIRAAVGASRGRIIRQLIVESMVLAGIAAVAGFLLAVWGADALVALAPAGVPRLNETRPDGWVLAFTLGISILSSVLFGLAPALHASKVDLNDALKQGGGRSVTGGSGGRIRSVLVVAEIALSVMLVVGAGLLLRSFHALMNVDNGFRPERVLVAKTAYPVSGIDEYKASRTRAVGFYHDLLDDLRSVPGVSAAGGTMASPGWVRSNGGYWVDRLPPQNERTVNAPQAVFSIITSGVFQTLGVPLKAGRDFSDADKFEAPYVAIVNEALARKAFPGKDPIGHVIWCGMDYPDKPMKIVGVVGDVRQHGPATAPWPEIYMAYLQHPGPASALELLVRTASDPMTMSESLRRKIREHSPEVPVEFTTLEATLADNVATPRFRTALLAIFGGVAMCLAMAGVYGVISYMVNQRANEIGVRMALGAGTTDVLRLIVKQGLILAGLGLAIGLVGAFAANRILSSMLFAVEPGDPITFLGVSALLAAVALAASLVPAMRAARMDPLAALRQE